MQKHIYESGIIGNCSFIAHVHKNTHITWLCWPRFDSSVIFGSLLDTQKSGEFSILPRHDFTSEQYYIDNTNVQDNRFRTTVYVIRALFQTPDAHQED